MILNRLYCSNSFIMIFNLIFLGQWKFSDHPANYIILSMNHQDSNAKWLKTTWLLPSVFSATSVCAQVVADFDMTLSRFTDTEGKPCDTCYRKLVILQTFLLSGTSQFVLLMVDGKIVCNLKCISDIVCSNSLIPGKGILKCKHYVPFLLEILQLIFYKLFKLNIFCGVGSLEGSKLLPSVYKEQALKLKNHYYAIEVHPSMSIAEKIPHMVEW